MNLKITTLHPIFWERTSGTILCLNSRREIGRVNTFVVGVQLASAANFMSMRRTCEYNLDHTIPFAENGGSADVIASLDANFGQKRRDGGNDPPLHHPYTHFVDEQDLRAMEDAVDAAHPPPKQAPNKHRVSPAAMEDIMEATGPPSSVLDTCKKTFEAADSRHQKASTQFFDDTESMAILCQHDRVLFVANMKSAGEKQFYALALIKALLKQLPLSVRFGILYDIGCQIHRSIVK
jgi:hypothetical protein